MLQRAFPCLTLAALLLAAGPHSAAEGLKPVSRQQLESIRNQQAARAIRISQSLEAGKFALGLGGLDGLQEYNRITDAFGFTHVRYHQTYRGMEVFNTAVLGHMDAQGILTAPHATVEKGIDLPPAPLLDEAKIKEIASRNLPQEGRIWQIQIKPIVFPTKYQGGLVFKRDTAGRFRIDPVYSVVAPHKAESHCWAFRVSILQATADGPASTEFVLDGLSGDILRKWEGQQHVAADRPAVGTGDSQYNGTVTLDTEYLGASNVFTLRDTTRATQPWPNPDPYFPCPEWGGIGFQTVCWDPSGPNAASTGTTLFTNAANQWGNGGVYDFYTDNPTNNFAPIGQTAAVDAHYAIQCTWDYYDHVLGRTGGIDGLGGSPISIVHDNYSDEAWDNAAWNPAWFIMMYGDGGSTGPLTCMDVAAHEMSHGVMSYTANLDDSGMGGESAGLNEGNSDIHATMAKYYWWGADGQGNTVPDSTTQAPGGHNTWDYLWTMGPQLSADGLTPIRWLYKPSKDGYSYDAWFDGCALDDPHFKMGPAIRAFFFLSQGASSDATQDTYSPYLPAGMQGIGNDKAIRIWYHAMTTKVTDPESDYHGIRAAMLEAVADLYPGDGGTDSAEVAGIKNAFAAINVGPAEGAQDPVMVTFPDHAASPFWDVKTLVVPAMVPIRLPVPTVANAQDTSVTWSLGGLSFLYPEGGLMEDGVMTAPLANYGNVWPVKATSKADPREFAVDVVFGVSLDADSDTETDACDMGPFALAYGGYLNVFQATNLYGARFTDDICLELFLEGFNNAYNQ